MENSRTVGEHFLAALRPLAERFPFIGEVRGSGLFLGIEMVRDRATREPMSKGACRRVFDECLRRGLLTMSYAANFRLQPAMTIDRATVDEGWAC